MSNISLKKLYVISSIKSSLINLFALLGITYIALSIYNKHELNNIVMKTVLTTTEMEQVEHFFITKNKDALDLFLIDQKSSHKLNTLKITNTITPTDCNTQGTIIICPANELVIYQELPLSKGNYLQFTYDRPELTQGLYFYLIAFIIFIFNLISSYLTNHFAQNEIRKQIKTIEVGNREQSDLKINEFEKIHKIISDSAHDQLNQKIAKSNIQIIRKLQHDILSPLTSLEGFFNLSKPHLKEDLRLLGRQAIDRIQDIINTLKINEENTVIKESSERHEIALYPMLKRIISEKRNEYSNRRDVKISLDSQDSKDFFVKIRKSDFYRTISNIINNSIEAQKDGEDLKISIKVIKVLENLNIYITDNGKGISTENLKEVFSYGKSFSKKNGSGIGLFQAKEYIESENGSISIESKEGIGTTIKITLQECESPKWYTGSIKIKSSEIVIVDDEESIHQLWREKLAAFSTNITYFSNSYDFNKWATNRDLNKYFYLFDLELIGSNQTGLDLIINWDLQENAVLVTSHFMNEEIQTRCVKSGVSMIPKESVNNIEVSANFQANNSNINTKEIILIDDDALVHSTWAMVAGRKNNIVHSFYSIDAFLNDSHKFSKDIPIYVDSNLGNDIKGEFESKKIYDKGFHQLTLATGMKIDSLPKWISGQQGKECPI